MGDGLSGADGLDVLGAGVDGLTGLAISAALALLVGLFIIVILPLLLLAGEALIVAAGVYVLSRRWVVEATNEGPPPDRYAWRVRGWRRSRKAVGDVTEALRQGREPELPGAELAPLR